MEFFEKTLIKINSPNYNSFEDNFHEDGMDVETRLWGLTESVMKWHDRINQSIEAKEMSYKQKAIVDLALVCIEDIISDANDEINKLDD